MENNSLSNKSKAIALFKWTNRKYLSVSIAYWILLFLAYPLAEIFIMITSIPVDGQHNEYVDRMQTYGVLIPSTLFAAIAIGYSIVISLIAVFFNIVFFSVRNLKNVCKSYAYAITVLTCDDNSLSSR